VSKVQHSLSAALMFLDTTQVEKVNKLQSHNLSGLLKQLSYEATTGLAQNNAPDITKSLVT
jgi:hypothetical protein